MISSPRLNQEGYALHEQFFGESELAELEVALDRFDPRHLSTDSEGRVTFAQKIAEKDPVIKAFACSPKMVEFATSLLGPNIDLYFNQYVVKYPGGDRAFSWHQDDAYSPVEPSPYLTIWVPVNDATPENGCLSVLPGSHFDGLRAHVDSDFGLAGHSMDDPDQGVLVPAKRGTMIAMWSTTLHKSGPNTSGQPRKALVLQYSATGMKHKATGLMIRPRIIVARSG